VVEDVVGADLETEGVGDPRVVDAVHVVPVEPGRERRIEYLLRRLQRHPLVDKGSAADAGGTQRGHGGRGNCFDDADVRVDGDVPAEELRGGAVPEHPLVRVGGTGEGRGVRAGLPATTALQDGDLHSGPRQAERGDSPTEAGADDDDLVVFGHGREVGDRGVVRCRCRA